jgi:hypothetical protein
MLPNTKEYTTDMRLKFGELGPIVRWCQDYCVGMWGYDVVDPAGYTEGRYQFIFDNEADYINFVLWKK